MIVVFFGDVILMMGEIFVKLGSMFEFLLGIYEFIVSKEGYKMCIEMVVIGEGVLCVIMSVNLSKIDLDMLMVGCMGGFVENFGEVRRLVGWSVLIVGVGLMVMGIVFVVISGVLESCSQFDFELCGDVRDLVGWFVFIGVFGGVLIVGGLGFLIWDLLVGLLVFFLEEGMSVCCLL